MTRFEVGMYSSTVLGRDNMPLFKRVYYVTKDGEADAWARRDAESARVHADDIVSVQVAKFDGKW